MSNAILLTFMCYIFVLVLANCKAHTRGAATSQPDFILGENDVRRVADIDPNSLPIAREIFDAASISSPMIMVKLKKGRKTGARFCSGLLLTGTDSLPRVLTNHHCFLKDTKEIVPDIMPKACDNTVVYFDKAGAKVQRDGIVPKLERKCQRGSLRTSFEGDMAIFTLAKPLPPDYTFAKIWDDDEIPINRKAFAIHYPSTKDAGVGMVSIKGGHEGKAPPKSITVKDCSIQKRLPPELLDQPIPEIKNSAHRLRYSVSHSCDLTGGSSGAALLDIETGKLLALHFGGLALPTERGYVALNTATHIMHLRQFLAEKQITMPPQPAM